MERGKCYLLNVPLENDYAHTYAFYSAEEQSSFFAEQMYFYFDDFSYQRKDGYIRVPVGYDELTSRYINYVMYQAEGHSKWYYAFVTKIEYKNPDLSFIYIETDVIQTWMFDVYFYPSFIEREHTNDDTVGANTIPEGLETGDYITNVGGKIRYNGLASAQTYILATTVDPNGTPIKPEGSEASVLPPISGAIYGGIFSGCKYFYYTKAENLANDLKKIAEYGQSDSVVAIFCAPNDDWILLDSDGTTVGGDLSNIAHTWTDTLADGVSSTPIKKATNLDGYIPRNNKLLTYPYCYILMDNSAGGTAIYQYEYFNNREDDEICNFLIDFLVCVGGSIKLTPMYYKNENLNLSESLIGAKLPTCSWNNDAYTNWLVQNTPALDVAKTSHIINGVGAGLGTILSAATGNVGGVMGGAMGVTNAFLGVQGVMAEQYAHSLTPPQIQGNVANGDVNFSAGYNTFTAYPMCIKREFAECIDSYFDMFGYKSHKVKIPNTWHRSRYWYIKTRGANLDGFLPQDDVRKIKAIYDNGITFWKDKEEIGNYYATDDDGEYIPNEIVSDE